MSDIITNPQSENDSFLAPAQPKRSRWWLPTLAVLLAGGAWFAYSYPHSTQASAPVKRLPEVTVLNPVSKDVDVRLAAIGQFSAINRVELRAQVGGTLTEIHFRDGQLVNKGDLLFSIDPRPYEIKLAQARAQLQNAKSRLELANNQLSRAQALNRNQFASQEVVDQRINERAAAQASVDDAQSRIRDAELDLEYTKVKAPFTGRIGARQVSIGGLIAGSRAQTSPTTLLATIVSLDPIYLDFDISEQEYLTFMRGRQGQKAPMANKVDVSLSDEADFGRQGTLDFLDNALNRSSGTIRARATVANPDLLLSPGQFGRVRLALTTPAPALLVPDAAVLPDQSEHIVLTLGANNMVTPKKVQLGDLRGGMRVIRTGLTASDEVIVDGIPAARPGSEVVPTRGSTNIAAKPSQD